MIRGLFVDVNI